MGGGDDLVVGVHRSVGDRAHAALHEVVRRGTEELADASAEVGVKVGRPALKPSALGARPSREASQDREGDQSCCSQGSARACKHIFRLNRRRVGGFRSWATGTRCFLCASSPPSPDPHSRRAAQVMVPGS